MSHDLEEYLFERSSSDEIVGKDIFRARTIPREALFGKNNK